MNREKEQLVFCLDKGLFRIKQTDIDGKFVDSYLLVGDERALLIDTQREKGSLYRLVRKLCDKPLEIVITHAHYDHLCDNVLDFVRDGVPVWIFEEELSTAVPPGFIDDAVCNLSYSFLTEGQLFALGGLSLKAERLSGHTAAGCMLLEEKKGWLFSGDALGNKSFYMHIPTAIPLHAFKTDLDRYYSKIRHIENLRIFPGHGIAEEYYGMDHIEDLVRVTDEILKGTVQGEPADDCVWENSLRLVTDYFEDGYLFRKTDLNL